MIDYKMPSENIATAKRYGRMAQRYGRYAEDIQAIPDAAQTKLLDRILLSQKRLSYILPQTRR